jgi:hypothetical protein
MSFESSDRDSPELGTVPDDKKASEGIPEHSAEMRTIIDS